MNGAWQPYVGLHPFPQSTLGMIGQLKAKVRGETITSPEHVITQAHIDMPIEEDENHKLIAFRIRPPKGMQVIHEILASLPETEDA